MCENGGKRKPELSGKALQLLQADQRSELHVREAARRLGASPSGAGAVLRDLERDGKARSRREGRNRVYRAIGEHRRLGPSPMTVQFPTAPEEWDSRPYFLWDRDMSWREFRDILRGDDAERRGWAVARVLDHARWPDLWRLTSPTAIRRDLGRIRVRHKAAWTELLVSPDAPR